jgi:branched-chain amino acid transport system permease protein
MGDFGSALLTGISVGCLYALTAVGFTIVFNAGGILNFVQGSVMVVGALIAGGIAGQGVGHGWLGFIAGAAAAGLLSALIYLLVLRSMTGADAFRLTIMTMGLSFIIDAAASLIWGGKIYSIDLVSTHSGVDILGIGRLSWSNIIGIGFTLAIFAALQVLFNRTKAGLQLRAASESPGLAMRSGINVTRLHAWSWALAGVIAGIAGVLSAAASTATVSTGDIALRSFPAAVLGGLGSIPGALVGGLLIGLVQQFSVYYINTSAATAITYGVLLLVLLVRPSGLLGHASLERA